MKLYLSIFLVFLFFYGCEIKNSPVEILLIKSSDSIAFSNDIVKNDKYIFLNDN